MSELTGSPPPLLDAGNIPVQSNMPPMVMVKWPHQVPLPYNPFVPAGYVIIPNGMYYFPPQWIPVMRVTAPIQLTPDQQIENAQTPNELLLRNNITPRYTMNPVDNIIRIGGPVTVFPQHARFNWQGPNVIVLQNYNQVVPWQSLNPPSNELQLIASPPRSNIQDIEMLSPTNNGYPSTLTPGRQDTNVLVNPSQDLKTSAQTQIQTPIQNHQVVQPYPPVTVSQHWNAPIVVPYEPRNNIQPIQDAPVLVPFERRTNEVKQPYQEANPTKHQNNPILKLDKQRPQNNNPINKVQENAFRTNCNVPQINEVTSPNVIQNCDLIATAKKNALPSDIKNAIEEDITEDVKIFNKNVEDFALSVDQETINRLLKRKVSTFCGIFFQEHATSPCIKKPKNMTFQKSTASTSASSATSQIIPPANKPIENATEKFVNNSRSQIYNNLSFLSDVPPIPTEVNFPPINNPNAFNFSEYKKFLDSQDYEDMLQRNYLAQLEHTKVLKRTLIALEQDEQKLRRFLKQEKPLYLHLVAVANSNTQMRMKKHITRFEYKKMLYRSVLKTKELCERIWNEQIKYLMVNDIERNNPIENVRNNRYFRQIKPKCCKQLFIS